MIQKAIPFIFCLFLLGNNNAIAQTLKLKEDGFHYYWAIDKLISLRKPTFSFGAEYRTPGSLALSFDAGLGKRHPIVTTEEKRVISHSIVLKTGLQLKYFYHKRYSKLRLRRWRRRTAKGKKVKIQNKKGQKYYFGLQLAFEPESYNIENYFYYTGIGFSFRPIYFEKAAVKTEKFRIGLLNGFQKKIKDTNLYYELGFAIGFQIKSIQYFDIIPTAAPSTSSFFFFLNEEDLVVGQQSFPYLHINLILGF